MNQPGLLSGVSSGRFDVTRLPAGLCQEGLTHRFVFVLIKTEKSRAYDGTRHSAGACLRGASNGQFRRTVTCCCRGCVHSAAEYKYPGVIVKELFFVCQLELEEPVHNLRQFDSTREVFADLEARSDTKSDFQKKWTKKAEGRYAYFLEKRRHR